MGKYYYAFVDDEFKRVLVNRLFFEDNHVLWSARLSTGLFGLTSCPSGNRGPKKYNEVILGVGDKGLRKIVELGFITCPSCKPEESDNFSWGVISSVVKEKYGLSSLSEYVDKNILPFDSRRVNYEEILPVVKNAPSRIYLPNNLSSEDVRSFYNRINDISLNIKKFKFPALGYYDPSVESRFTEYPSEVSEGCVA